MSDNDDQLRAIICFCILTKLYGFANFVPYECTNMGLLVIEASMWLLNRGFIVWRWLTIYAMHNKCSNYQMLWNQVNKMC